MKRVIIILALVATVALPFILRPPQATSENADDSLVIITPHNEAIRHEFTTGFKVWYKNKTGRSAQIDWRVIGGTSEIARFLDSEYVSSFQNYWTNQLGKSWSMEVQSAFANGRLNSDASTEGKAAREAFLNSDVGCGIDLFFGGGSYDFIRQAQARRLVGSRIIKTHPEWFTDNSIPITFAGEQYWDDQGRWIGNVLSSYGILYNKDSIKRLGLITPPKAWRDLTDPKLIGEVALCDPTKSGSIAKAFENLIQQQMQIRLRSLNQNSVGRDPKEIEAQAIREGWDEGMKILRLLGANARYFTDSSQKPPIDVSQGNSAAGICIDFYGRYQAEAVTRRDDSGRLVYVTPLGGTVSSVDPIGLLRGAPNKEVAEMFIEFTLSMAGQKLWNFQVGTPDGPERFALRRLPVRREFYAEEAWLKFRSDPTEEPYSGVDQLIYEPAWTGGLFREMAFGIRVMCLDTHAELVEAWRAIIAAGMPPEAMSALNDMSILSYEQISGPIKQALGAKNKVDEVRLAKKLGAQLRVQYQHAAELAREGK
jgi:iron(III) transport system substrate-binding protein|uniref:ABC transporter substrate-binding protein n=2 Tax=Cephaloticoccus sp. TaxID=1985742 RepID=UPI004049674C